MHLTIYHVYIYSGYYAVLRYLSYSTSSHYMQYTAIYWLYPSTLGYVCRPQRVIQHRSFGHDWHSPLPLVGCILCYTFRGIATVLHMYFTGVFTNTRLQTLQIEWTWTSVNNSSIYWQLLRIYKPRLGHIELAHIICHYTKVTNRA